MHSLRFIDYLNTHSWCFTFIPSLSISGYNLQMPPMKHRVSGLWVFAHLLSRTEVLLRRDVMLQQSHALSVTRLKKKNTTFSKASFAGFKGFTSGIAH